MVTNVEAFLQSLRTSFRAYDVTALKEGENRWREPRPFTCTMDFVIRVQ